MSMGVKTVEENDLDDADLEKIHAGPILDIGPAAHTDKEDEGAEEIAAQIRRQFPKAHIHIGGANEKWKRDLVPVCRPAIADNLAQTNTRELASMLSASPSAASTSAEAPEWIAMGRWSDGKRWDEVKYQIQTVNEYMHPFTGMRVLEYIITGEKLRGSDSRIVPPTIELADGHVNEPPLKFTLKLTPTTISNDKGGKNFKKSKGKGSIDIKCENPREAPLESYPFSFYVAVGQHRHGPITHDFAIKNICTLPKEWDFSGAVDYTVDKKNGTFVVRREVVPLLGQVLPGSKPEDGEIEYQ
jgi:hypothetical protein